MPLASAEIRSSKKQKRREKISDFYYSSFNYILFEGFFVFAFHATAETVNVIMATTTDMSATLLNSGTFGVEVEPVGVEVPVLDVGVEVGLEVEVPLDGSDTTASEPMLPDVEPGLLIA